ncbi:MAG: type II toxin-antitoxin system ParD family antitoxin [Aridibacter sp.]
MNVSLTKELEEMINQKVQSGLYNSASEVIREGLRLLNEQDLLKQIRIEELRREVQKGVDQVRAGNFNTYNSGKELADEIIRRGMKKLEENNGE